MAASASDKLIKGVRRWAGQIGASGVADGSATTIPLVSTTGLPTDTAVEITIDRVDANGVLTPSKEEVVCGVVSGSNIISATRGVEGTAQAHSAGAVVEVRLTASQWNKMVDAILLERDQQGRRILTPATYSPAGAGTTTLDLLTGRIQRVTMPAATQTLAISNGATGQAFIVEIINTTGQGALTWFSTIKWAEGVTPTLTGTNGKKDTFGFIITGTGTYDGYVVGQNI